MSQTGAADGLTSETNGSEAAQESAATTRNPPVYRAKKSIVSGRQFLVDIALICVWLVATDWLIYRLGTFAAWAVFLGLSTAGLAILKHASAQLRGSLLIGGLLTLLAIKLVWGGSFLAVVCASGLLVCYGMALTGFSPYLPEAFGFAGFMLVGLLARLRKYRFGSVSSETGAFKPLLGIQVLLPVAVVSLFGGIFVLANPDLASLLSVRWQSAWRATQQFFAHFEIGEAIFLLASTAFLLGLLYPALPKLLIEKPVSVIALAGEPTTLQRAYRNTLLALIALFAVYLVFEFSTLWFRDFPENFYYAGYAHRGAFWLTSALALATSVLSAIFQRETLKSPNIRLLKKLAVAWSIENFLLAVAVYNRLFIYIDFNGFTRMRFIGILGITCVVVGLGLVVRKLLRDRDVIWLIHRQLWVPAMAVIAYAILPVDWMVNRFNAAQVQSGNLAPAVQIIAHETSAEGILPLIGLTEIDDATIREGVRALLALWAVELQLDADSSTAGTQRTPEDTQWRSEYGHSSPWLSREPTSYASAISRSQRRSVRGITDESTTPFAADETAMAGWYDYQMSHGRLRIELMRTREAWLPYARDTGLRHNALNAFFKYAYRWY